MLELHYPMIQFLIKIYSQSKERDIIFRLRERKKRLKRTISLKSSSIKFLINAQFPVWAKHFEANHYENRVRIFCRDQKSHLVKFITIIWKDEHYYRINLNISSMCASVRKGREMNLGPRPRAREKGGDAPPPSSFLACPSRFPRTHILFFFPLAD